MYIADECYYLQALCSLDKNVSVGLYLTLQLDVGEYAEKERMVRNCSKGSETEGKNLSVNEESIRNPGRVLSTRAASADARLRTQAMLDLI